MEGSVKDLSKYRFERAEEDLYISKILFEGNNLRASANRSYYAIFHALRAVHALDGFDSSKHSGIMGTFNERYIKAGVFPKDMSRDISLAYRIREKSDYEDFFIISKEDAKEQIERAEHILNLVGEYLSNKWSI